MMKQFRIAASFDTETTNIEINGEWRAFPVLFIIHDLRYARLASYEEDPGATVFKRDEAGALEVFDLFIAWGQKEDCTPVVCAYNLLFDLQPIMWSLRQRYEMRVNAQSSTHAYTVDLYDGDSCVMRFWDTYYLEMRGLSAMGVTAGMEKASGDWDYSLTRTPETALSADERFYAGRDTEVIPAYLRYLLGANEWLKASMLSSRVLTKTSLVRMAGRLETGRLKSKRPGREAISVQKQFQELCAQEFPRDYETYALRKACFRGGLTFTAGKYSGVVIENVLSLDEVSAHHAYINGHMVPVRFSKLDPETLQRYAERIIHTSKEEVYRYYEEPFGCALHACVRFENLRLKRDSAFDALGIATLARGKFDARDAKGDWGGELDIDANESIKARGFIDRFENGRFAFGKLYSADACEVFVTEIELYIISRVYDFSSMRVLFGEASCSFVKPPDYVTLLSNLLFKRKQALKCIIKSYKEGEPFAGEIDESIPEGIAERLRAGDMSESDLQGYYTSTVKGQFNSIYGMEAQDVFKPSYAVDGEGELYIDPDTRLTPDNYAEIAGEKRKSLVLYTYGMRIVGGSRLALVCAIEDVWERFGSCALVLGGDTDSLKIACAGGVTGDYILQALDGFHRAVTRSIDMCMSRIRRKYPDYASDLKGVGTFEVECSPYKLHMEAWNKARVSWDGMHAHITCAGLPRPRSLYNIERWMDDCMELGLADFRTLAPMVLGWGVRVDHRICGVLEHRKPLARDVFDEVVTDYRGDSSRVTCHESIALYPSDRVLGDLDGKANRECVDYLKALGRDVDTSERYITYRVDKDKIVPEYYELDEMGEWVKLF